jgi:hypothetical protein
MEEHYEEYGNDLAGLSLELQQCLDRARRIAERMQGESAKRSADKSRYSNSELEEIEGLISKSLRKTNMFMFSNGVSDWTKL